MSRSRNGRNRGSKFRYVKRKPSSKMAQAIKNEEIFTGVMKVQLDLGFPIKRPKVIAKIGDIEIVS